MRLVNKTILAGLCVGVIGACAATREGVAGGDGLGAPIAEVRADATEPMKLADAVVAAAPVKGEEKDKKGGAEQPALPSGHPPVGLQPAAGRTMDGLPFVDEVQ